MIQLGIPSWGVKVYFDADMTMDRKQRTSRKYIKFVSDDTSETIIYAAILPNQEEKREQFFSSWLVYGNWKRNYAFFTGIIIFVTCLSTSSMSMGESKYSSEIGPSIT